MIEYLNIVDENDEVIGQETRENIHKQGLLHREVHVHFVTPNKEIILQHRAKDKDFCPDLLSATVGGHVEIGDTYEKTAIKETREETGLIINEEDLIFLNKSRRGLFFDEKTNTTNNVFGTSYLYRYLGDLSDLKVEEGKAIGFELWSFDKLKKLSEPEKEKFIPYVLNFILDNLVD
ncbi:MAG: NUDIX domain-containing protein [Patescibacteria group bacterium]|nr:NUDIX domain-containing protein [Patescibacteria group bacterium]